MANAAIVVTNLADLGTVSASTAETNMPVSRVQNQHVGKRWRSTAAPATLLCNFSSDQTFDTLALFGLTGSSSATMRVRVSSNGEGNDSYTKVLLHMDGSDASTTFTDSNAGGSAHTWTAAGNAQIDTADSKFGGASGLFDGTGDDVSTPDHADFALGSGDFTVDFWFKVNAASGSELRACGQSDTSLTAADSSFRIYRTTGNVMRADVSNGSALTSVTGTTQFTNAVNTGWHHLALVRTGNVLKLFIDGTQEGSNVAFSGTVPNSTATLSVGSRGGGTGAFSPWNGWLDEFRISVGIARWTSAFTPPSVAYGGSAGELGDIYDSGALTATSQYFDYRYGQTGSLVLPLSASVSGRRVLFNPTDSAASYVEAGRLVIGLREAFTYNFVPGAAAGWNDRSRREKSAGGQTLIFPDGKFRSFEINFDWVTEAQREALWDTLGRVNGNSKDVLLMLDTASDSLPRDSIWGLVTSPIRTAFTGIADIYTAPLSVEERL